MNFKQVKNFKVLTLVCCSKNFSNHFFLVEKKIAKYDDGDEVDVSQDFLFSIVPK